MEELKVGIGKSEIKFSQDMFPIEGFIGIHDNPYVRILVVEKEEKIAIAALELVMLPEDILEQLKSMIADKTGVPKGNIWIHVTHAITTPHAPGGPDVYVNGSPKEIYRRKLYEEAIAAAVRCAAKEAAVIEPAEIGIRTGICNINGNRDVKTKLGWWISKAGTGYSNHEFTVIGFRAKTGKSLAYWFSYGIKACAIDNSEMNIGKRFISSDVPGKACRVIEEFTKVPVLFTMSAAGDQVPVEQAWYDREENGKIVCVDHGVQHGLEIVDNLGKTLAEDVERVISVMEFHSQEAVLEHCTDSFIWKGMKRIEKKPRKVIEYVEEGEKEIPVDVIKFGELALVAGKPEINAITEAQLKERSDNKYTLLLSMVNGGMKYMPDREAYERITWEAQSSMLMPGAAEEFVKRAVELLHC